MPSFWNSLLGSKPSVPDLPSLDLGKEQQKAIQNNIAALPGAEKLVGAANLFSREQIDQMLNAVIPGYSGMKGQVSQNIEDMLAGKIPTDVSSEVTRSGAARALSGGFAGSGMHADLVARDLGLTSLDLTQKGLNSLENWMKTSASLYEPSMMNVQSMFISPGQQAGFDVQEREAQFQKQWMQSQISAMPAMWAQDLKEAVEATLSAYGGASYQHAGTLPIQGGVGSGGGGWPGSPGYGEPGGTSTTFFDTSNDPGGELSAGGGGSGGFMGII